LQGLLSTLEEMGKDLELCEKDLAEFLESKRRIFPRFYFVSTNMLLDILSNGNRPWVVAQHINAMFQGIKELKMSGSPQTTVDALVANEGEEVPLKKKGSLKLNGKVEVYLGDLIERIRAELLAQITEAISDYVRHFARQAEGETGEAPSVGAVAAMAAEINYRNKHLLGAMIVAGWDAAGGAQIVSLPIGGTVVPVPWAVEGSGSTFIWGYLDSEFRPGLDQAGAEALVREAVALAAARDGSSGGVIRTVVVTSAGAQRGLLRGGEVPAFFEERQLASRPVFPQPC